MYDAAVMHVSARFPIALFAAVLALVAPAAAQNPVGQAAAPGLTLSATRVVGTDSVRITGTAPAARPLEAAVYATFSQDLPTVLLSRRIVSTDANGRYDTTLTTAPAYFRNAIVTVVVRVPDGAGASTTLRVVAPNVPAPPDDIPASVR